MLNVKQLLGGTEEEFMNHEQLEFMRNLLLSMRQEVTSEQGLNQVISESERCSDPLDQAQQEMDHLTQLRKRSIESDLLSDIEKALYKVENGEYGYCESSGEPIDIRRLLAYPTSRNTTEEQDRLEKIFEINSRVGLEVG